ncbi:DUF397 domain-containing protein [Kibdelosporangium philippinense]|uniref:DUF397 domain-containing protein n=1 Tax=Kibdelosporangium philippinense TaxID=211113 RepID=A0ABS8Z2R7_9PSEU|nr:DUF397 domain-containing protein [Kibdelosporangium philippinense]MCE7002135.1 DUF397 domain-containing protein [Kibdelosporangium philippinense]
MDLSAATWRKSSRSGSQSDCVEVAMTENLEAIRDSKNPECVLTVDVRMFVRLVRAGRFDR